MMNSEKILDDLVECVTEAKAHYQIWWALVNEARPKFVAAMNRYPDFFTRTVRAHDDSMVLNLSYLFDTDRNVSSLYTYLRLIKSELSHTDYSFFYGSS
jgi:hypothetical protein